VQQLVDEFRAGPGGDCRHLANFTLPASLVRHPLSGVDVNRAGDISVPIPDTPAQRVFHGDLLNWTDQRDGFAFAEQVWCAVEALVDGLLEAFEKAVPRRLQVTATGHLASWGVRQPASLLVGPVMPSSS
jgi:hypothetical protein